MSIPSMATLTVVVDPTSRESGSSVSLADAARDLWKQWRAERRLRHGLALASDDDLREIGVAQDEIGLVRQHAAFTPRAWSWTGDIARPGR